MVTEDGSNMIFLVGCPRSGTTWLQRLLSSHPKIHTGQESDLFDIYIGPQLRAWQEGLNLEASGRGGIGLACYMLEKEFVEALKGYMFKILEVMLKDIKEDQLFLEKTPSHALFINEIIELLPKAKIIHLLRDPRDVSASLFASARGWGKQWAPRTPYRASNMWISHVSAARRAKKKLSSDQFYEVRYESLVISTSQVMRELSDFLDIKWSDAQILDTVESNTIASLKAGYGTAIPIKGAFMSITGGRDHEPTDFIRKGTYGNWQTDLTWYEKILLWIFIRKKARSYGYSWNKPW